MAFLLALLRPLGLLTVLLLAAPAGLAQELTNRPSTRLSHQHNETTAQAKPPPWLLKHHRQGLH
ncbi:hypothetical protein [Zoogloea sp. LCSB751]|uniref:hypothetical protein n=1 Tax=Zoogloea sp. LCSB751 TaxID=1965277 RepID=UPI0009A4AEC6|nr:hypothetical protein [Zoogloea sp. LCSB751]